MRGFFLFLLFLALTNLAACSIYQSEGRKQFENNRTSAVLVQTLQQQSCLGDYEDLQNNGNEVVTWSLVQKNSESEFWSQKDKMLVIQKQPQCTFKIENLSLD